MGLSSPARDFDTEGTEDTESTEKSRRDQRGRLKSISFFSLCSLWSVVICPKNLFAFAFVPFAPSWFSSPDGEQDGGETGYTPIRKPL